MGGPGSFQSGQSGKEDRVANRQVAVLVVLVPATAPVSDDDLRLVLPDDVRDGQGNGLIERDLRIRVGQPGGFGPQQPDGFFGGRAL